MSLAQAVPGAAQAQAFIQARIGEFLSARQVLEGLRRRARTADDLTAVERLFVEQGQLEGELAAALPLAQAVAQGRGDFAGAARVAAFAARLEIHLREVRGLRARLRGETLQVGVSWTGLLTFGGVVAALGLLWLAARR